MFSTFVGLGRFINCQRPDFTQNSENKLKRFDFEPRADNKFFWRGRIIPRREFSSAGMKSASPRARVLGTILG